MNRGLIHDGNGLYTITDRLPERSDDLMNTDVNELLIENVVKSGPDFSCGRGIGKLLFVECLKCIIHLLITNFIKLFLTLLCLVYKVFKNKAIILVIKSTNEKQRARRIPNIL